MTLQAAPLFTDHGAGPVPGAAYWLKTDDDVRIRIGVWAPEATKGTVLLFCGRTEYVEKYAIPAGDLAARGYATVAIDWRGQGLADRLLEDGRIGHVGEFRDYQKDVAAMLRATRVLDLPEPYFLLAHSMGGGIGLRALHEDLPVAAAAFTGPMWGIRIAPALQPVAWVLTRLMPALGLGGKLAPTTQPEPYVLRAPFEDNILTTDPEMHQMMRDQVTKHEALCLGGPSYMWLGQALGECATLATMASPKVPCLTFVGGNERIVHTGSIDARMKAWPTGDLHVLEGCEHEVLMEGPKTRQLVFDHMSDHFKRAA